MPKSRLLFWRKPKPAPEPEYSNPWLVLPANDRLLKYLSVDSKILLGYALTLRSIASEIEPYDIYDASSGNKVLVSKTLDDLANAIWDASKVKRWTDYENDESAPAKKGGTQ